MGWLRAILRGAGLAVLIYGGLLLFLLLRLIERPFTGLRRPLSGGIVRGVFRGAFVVLGMGYRVRGKPMAHPGGVVSNHTSWLDIMTLHACQRVIFVSKDDVARWPAIGFLARVTGTLFIRRDPREAQAQQALLAAHFRAGEKLLFFPEGTSSDGIRVLPFKSTLFQSFYTDGLGESLWVQPVAVVYHAPEGEDPRFYGWWGEMGFGPNALQILSARHQGSVEVYFLDPLRVRDYPSRKALCAAAEAAVRSAHPFGKASR